MSARTPVSILFAPPVRIALVLIVASVVASQLRRELTYGQELGAEYDFHPLGLFLIHIASTVIAWGTAAFAGRFTGMSRYLNTRRPFRVLIVALGLSAAGVLVLFPDVSGFQVIYFAIAALFLGAVVIVVPVRVNRSAPGTLTFLDYVRKLGEYQALLMVWLRYNIQLRYSQTFLGILWIVLLPLTTSLVLAFSFTVFLGARTIDVPFVSFLLSGQVVFAIFQSVVQKSQGILNANAGTIKQVYYPREILIVLMMGETLVDFSITLVAMLVINALFGILPNAAFALLPLPILLMVGLALGTAFFISCWGLIVRDLEPVVGVLMQLLFFTTVLFNVNQAPQLSFLRYINPLSGIVEAVRDIVLYGRVPDFAHLLMPAVLSIVLLITGYVYFKRREEMFADLL